VYLFFGGKDAQIEVNEHIHPRTMAKQIFPP